MVEQASFAHAGQTVYRGLNNVYWWLRILLMYYYVNDIVSVDIAVPSLLCMIKPSEVRSSAR